MWNLLFRRLKVVPDMTLDSHIIGHYKVSGSTNESLAEDPVLKNVAPNAAEGTDLQLYNFKFGGLSGIGGVGGENYGTDLTKWIVDYAGISEVKRTSRKAKVIFKSVYNWNHFRLQSNDKLDFIIKIPEGGYVYISNFIYNDQFENSKEIKSINGIVHVTLPEYNGHYRWIMVKFPEPVSEYEIEVLPNSPNSLVFNGTSPVYPINIDNTFNYHTDICGFIDYNILKITKQNYNNYRYITEKAIITDVDNGFNINIPLYKIKVNGLIGGQSFSVGYSYSTDSEKTVHNVFVNTKITNGENIINSVNKEIIPDTENDYCYIELNQIKWNKDPILIWTNTSNWSHYPSVATFTVTSDAIHITKVYNTACFIWTKIESISVPYRVKITGLKDGQTLLYEYSAGVQRMSISKDGEYNLPYDAEVKSPHNMSWAMVSKETDVNITIEQISGYPQDITVECMPVYPTAATKMFGRISSPEMTKVRCMVMDFTPLDLYRIVYDGRSSLESNNVAIFTDANTVAYIARSRTSTYIDGVANHDKLAQNLLLNDQVIAVNYTSESQNIYIGCNVNTEYKARMAFRQLMLFDRELTEQEIKYITQKMIKERKEE